MKSLLTFAVLCFALSSFGQADFDERLLSKFSEEQIRDFQQDHPRALEYWTFYLDNSFEIIEAPLEKDLSELEEVKIKGLKSMNILDLEITMLGQSSQKFRIKGTDKILVLYSKERFIQLFNEKSNS